MLAAGAVHTTGVNVEGVVANVASITLTVSIIGAFITKSVKQSINDNIRIVVEEIIAKEVTPKFDEIHLGLSDLQKGQDRLKEITNAHAITIARLEGVQEGKRMVTAEAGITTRGNEKLQ